jgi:hypothetical protein
MLALVAFWVPLKQHFLLSLHLSLYGFTGLWLIANAFHRYFRCAKVSATQPVAIAAAVAFLFWPSVQFWSAGIVKEALAWALVGWVVYFSWPKVYNGRFILSAIAGAVLLSILFVLRPYIAAPLGILLLLLHLNRFPKVKWWHLVGVASVAVGLVLWFYPLPLQLLIEHLHINHLKILGKPQPELLPLFRSKLAPTVYSFIILAPLALLEVMFRPFLFESKSLLYVAQGIENAVLFVICLIALVSAIQSRVSFFKIKSQLLLLVLFVLPQAVVVTLATPNFGTLSRYRTNWLPVLVFVLVLCNLKRDKN